MHKLEEPVNANERYLYHINVKLNILIEMFSSLLQTIADEKGIAVTQNKDVQEEVKGDILIPKRKKK